MGKKKTPDSTEGADDEIVLEGEKPPRSDSTAKCRILNAEYILPETELEKRLIVLINDVSGNETAKGIRGQIFAILRERGIDEAICYVKELRNDIDEVFGNGKTDELLNVLAQDEDGSYDSVEVTGNS